MSVAFDVVVIGAGIHGAGVAQAMAAAGHRVRVLEQTGVAAGTSCRSSKLIHGGLRYLESGQLRLVQESLRERETLLRLAPSLVQRVPFHVPVYRRSTRSRLTIRAGLSLYAVLGGLQAGSRFQSLPRADWEHLDGLATHGLRAVYRYTDAQTDDAKLTQAVMRSAQSLGAELLCPAEFIAAARRADGWQLRYRTATGEQDCSCRVLVNAAGPWVREVLSRLTPAVPMPDIELVQGTHIVVDGALHQGVYYVEAADRRAVFIMPWRGGLTLIGTTETAYTGDPARAAPLPVEIEYLLETYRQYFPDRDTVLRDRFAGLRVLPKSPASAFGRSRETLFLTDNEQPPRLLSVVGGKLTGYRAAAEQVVARLAASLPVRTRQADTQSLPLE